MKKYKYLLILLVSLFVSCSEESVSCSEESEEVIKNPLHGKWNVTELDGGFSPLEQFDAGDIVFNFMENDSVSIELDITLENFSKFPFKNDTVLYYRFDYDSIEITIGDIMIGDIEFEYLLSDSVLKLFDDLVADGIMIELEK